MRWLKKGDEKENKRITTTEVVHHFYDVGDDKIYNVYIYMVAQVPPNRLCPILCIQNQDFSA